MSRKFRGLLCILLVWSGSAVSQPLQVESRTMSWKTSPGYATSPPKAKWAEGVIKMPYVKAADPGVEARINDALYLTAAVSPAPPRGGRTFPGPGSEWLGGIASIGFTVARNDGRILSISVDGENCAAYCDNYRQEFSFDAQTGRLLALDDLLTPQGLAAAGQRILKERERQYAGQIRKLQQDLAALKKRETGKNVDLGDTQDRIDLNEHCLLGLNEQLKELKDSDAVRHVALATRFTLPAGKGISLAAERCSVHANRALDDVHEVETKISIKELSPWLTDYGKMLLLGEGLAAEPTNPFGQVLRGKVGTAAVTVLLQRPYHDSSLHGIYYYEKHRKPILLFGNRTGNVFEFAEQAGGNEEARITLTVSGDQLAGQWQNRNRKLPITLSRQQAVHSAPD